MGAGNQRQETTRRDLQIGELEGHVAELRSENSSLAARIGELERLLGQNSGNAGKPSSRDGAAERQRQAKERQERAARSKGAKRRQGKQRGAKGTTLEMSPTPDHIVDHVPERCEACGEEFDESADRGYTRRQVTELPEVVPETTEHRAHTYGCSCGHETKAPFPSDVRAPVTFGPRIRAYVAYLLARQHLPNRRAQETMADLFGLHISMGAIDATYGEAARRLKGFIVALVALLKSLPVLHADETTDRLGTKNVWMHVVSTSLYTLIHASSTRGEAAIEEAGVLKGYRAVIVHDRLALHWKLKRAKHSLCGAHLLRDLADVAVVMSQAVWASGLAALLVEINTACDDARLRHLKKLAPSLQRAFAKRYDDLVAAGLAGLLDAMHTLLAGCARVLRPGGIVAMTVRPWWHNGQLIDLPGALVDVGESAGLVLFERNVALLAALRDDDLVPRASFFALEQVRKARQRGIARSVTAHEDLLTFSNRSAAR